MKLWGYLLVMAASAGVLVACGAPSPGCTSGQTIACACPGGTQGTQTCMGGSYGACMNCGSSGACTDGQTQSCACTSGGSGTETCAGGAWGSCDNCPTTCETTGCNAGYQCGSAGVCVLNPSAGWTLTATNATVSVADCTGTFWDVGGYPDPYLSMTINGVATTTPAPSDTTTPVWNTNINLNASQLLSGVTFQLLDEDTVSPDVMCNGTLTFTEEDLVAGHKTVICRCMDGSDPQTLNFTVNPR